MARAARNASTRSGGHFAVIGISQLGTPAFFCTHADVSLRHPSPHLPLSTPAASPPFAAQGELAELWRDPDLQQWLRQRNEAAPEAPDDDAATVSARSPAYKTLKVSTNEPPTSAAEAAEGRGGGAWQGLGKLKKHLASHGIVTVQDVRPTTHHGCLAQPTH